MGDEIFKIELLLFLVGHSSESSGAVVHFPETQMSPLSKKKVVFRPSIFRCKLAVPWRDIVLDFLWEGMGTFQNNQIPSKNL